jgi:hypothetical protein
LEVGLPNEKKSQEPIKVTDKRIFTPDGEIRDEYRESIKPGSTPPAPAPPAAEAAKPAPAAPGPETKKPQGDPAQNPETPFTLFLESLIYSAYASLGMVQNPYQPQQTVDLPSARQMVDIVSMLAEKTKGNLEPDEKAFVETHIAQLQLAYVQRSKAIR